MKFSVLSSGSKGNVVYIESGEDKILLDAGLGPRSLSDRMAAIGRSPRDLTAVFLTHEHSDHVKGAGPLTKKIKVPVYSTSGTYKNLQKNYGPLPTWNQIQQEDKKEVGGLSVESFATPHDAAESVAFVVHKGARKLGYVTDLGKVTPDVRKKLSQADVLLVESNHDIEMLEEGSYPWPVKQRIRSDLGHLSNEACADLLSCVSHNGLQMVVLMHLSANNNRPQVALGSARKALKNAKLKLIVARQSEPTPLFPVY